MPDGNGRIGKLDFPNRSRDGDNDGASVGSNHSGVAHSGHFFEHVAEGVLDRDREKMRREVLRYASFFWAIVSR